MLVRKNNIAGEMAQVVECLLSKREALSSDPTAANLKKKKKEGERLR
jgi:hypothetical protein